jgi:hypothetical protein
MKATQVSYVTHGFYLLFGTQIFTMIGLTIAWWICYSDSGCERSVRAAVDRGFYR